jgi:hypothetical protein
VPVFSRFGMMQNYNYIVLSPQKKHKTKPEGPEQLLDKENLKFQITKPTSKSVSAQAVA